MNIEKITEALVSGRTSFVVFAQGIAIVVPKTQHTASTPWGDSEIVLSALCTYAVKLQDALPPKTGA